MKKRNRKIEPEKTIAYDPSAPLPDDLVKLMNEYRSLSDKAQRTKHIYACVGLALYWAQCFEVEMQLSLIFRRKAEGELSSGKEHDDFNQQLSDMTQGKLIRHFEEFVELDDCGRDLLKAALRARNSLAHGFFERHSEDFLHASGQERMLDELLEWIRLFQLAEGLSQVVTNAQIPLFGKTREEMEAEAQKYLESKLDL